MTAATKPDELSNLRHLEQLTQQLRRAFENDNDVQVVTLITRLKVDINARIVELLKVEMGEEGQTNG